MKINSLFSRPFGKVLRPAFLLVFLAGMFAGAERVQATPVAGSFVEELQGFISVDTRVDTSVNKLTSGTTYVLGRDDSNNAILRKYDASGAELSFTSGNTATNVVYI